MAFANGQGIVACLPFPVKSHSHSHSLKIPWGGFGFWLLVCYATTQLATLLRQRCIQVVRSNKEARKRLTESNGTPAMDLGHMNVILK